jgi:hypothetical protein
MPRAVVMTGGKNAKIWLEETGFVVTNNQLSSWLNNMLMNVNPVKLADEGSTPFWGYILAGAPVGSGAWLGRAVPEISRLRVVVGWSGLVSVATAGLEETEVNSSVDCVRKENPGAIDIDEGVGDGVVETSVVETTLETLEDKLMEDPPEDDWGTWALLLESVGTEVLPPIGEALEVVVGVPEFELAPTTDVTTLDTRLMIDGTWWLVELVGKEM